MSEAELAPMRRGAEIVGALGAVFAKARPRLRFVPFARKRNAYFAVDLAEALAELASPQLDFALASKTDLGDLAIFTCHGDDMASALWKMRRRFPDTILVVWFWDNHHAKVLNLRTALAADIVIPAHDGFRDELINPLSIRAPTIPLGCAQWSRAEATTLFAKLKAVPRSDALSGGFVRYDFSPRQAVLDRLVQEMPESAISILPRDRQQEFFDQDPETRLRSWMTSKVSLMLPVYRDLSLRVFDALLAGQTLIAPRDLPDLDRVLPAAMQRELGIVRFDAPEPEPIRAAWREALAIFNAQGEAGIRRRHLFVRDGHMMTNRVLAIADDLRRIARRDLPLGFSFASDTPCGLITGPG